MPRQKKSEPKPGLKRSLKDAAMDPAMRERVRLGVEAILAPFRDGRMMFIDSPEARGTIAGDIYTVACEWRPEAERLAAARHLLRRMKGGLYPKRKEAVWPALTRLASYSKRTPDRLLSELGEIALSEAVADDAIGHFNAQELNDRGLRRLSTRLNALLTRDILGTADPRKSQREEAFKDSRHESEDPAAPLRQEVELFLTLHALQAKGHITKDQAEIGAAFIRTGTKAKAARLLRITPAAARQRLFRLKKKIQENS